MELAAPHARARIEGLDAWRAALMLGGLLLHATFLKEQRPLFDAIGLVSGSFRMGGFFVISGLLSGFSIMKRKPELWLSRRLMQIGVPMLFGLLVICPLIRLILFQGQADTLAPTHRFDWYHLWFLVALLLYTMIGYGVHVLDRQHGIFAEIDARCGSGRILRVPVLLGVASTTFVLMTLTGRTVIALSPAGSLEPLMQCRAIVGYAPVYLLGFTLARAPEFRAAMLAGRTAAALILCVVASAYLLWYGVLGHPFVAVRAGWWDGFIPVAGASLCPPAVAVLILRSATSIRRVPALVRKLAEASFTMYILHFPVLVLLNLGFSRTAWNPYAEYAAAVMAAAFLTYALHVFVVRRPSVLSLLLNGRPMPPKTERVPA